MGRLLAALGGGALFAAALAISLPGVEAVRADALDAYREAAPAPSGSAPMCRARSAPVGADAIERLVAQVRSQAAAGDGEDRPISLNTRGYNYRRLAPVADPRLLELERKLQPQP